MQATQVLLQLVGSVALLVWGVRMVRTGVVRALGSTAAVLKDSWTLRLVLGGFGSDLFIALLVAALVTWAAHSSVAIVLLIMSLAEAGVVPLPLALALVLGANLGGAFAPWIMLSGSRAAARRVPLGNLIVRGVVALLCLPLVGLVAEEMSDLSLRAGFAVVLFHMLFNIAVALVGLPLVGVMARFLPKITSHDQQRETDAGQPRHLDPSVLDTPS